MASSNEAPKIKTFLMAKQSFLNALQNAKRCSRRFKKERSEEPDEHDEALLHFIKRIVQRFPKDAEGIPRTRSVTFPRCLCKMIDRILHQGKDHESQRPEKYHVSLSSSFTRTSLTESLVQQTANDCGILCRHPKCSYCP